MFILKIMLIQQKIRCDNRPGVTIVKHGRYEFKKDGLLGHDLLISSADELKHITDVPKGQPVSDNSSSNYLLVIRIEEVQHQIFKALNLFRAVIIPKSFVAHNM